MGLDDQHGPQSSKELIAQFQTTVNISREEMHTRMQRVLNLDIGEIFWYNCFATNDFVTGKVDELDRVWFASEKGIPVKLEDLLEADMEYPFGIQFIGANRIPEDAHDEVGRIVYEPIHELVALRREGDDIIVFEKCGSEQAEKESSLKASIAYFQDMVEEGEVTIRIF